MSLQSHLIPQSDELTAFPQIDFSNILTFNYDSCFNEQSLQDIHHNEIQEIHQKGQAQSLETQNLSTDGDFIIEPEQTAFNSHFVSYDQAKAKQNSSMKVLFEKIINQNNSLISTSSSSGSSSGLTDFILERDPYELYKEYAVTPLNLSEQIDMDHETPFSCQESFENQSKFFECEPKIFINSGSKDSWSPKSSEHDVSENLCETFEEKKSKKGGINKKIKLQSKFKNTYSLTEEHTRRLTKDFLDLDGFELKKVEKEEKKDEMTRRSEEQELEADYMIFESLDQKCSDLKKDIKILKKEGCSPDKLDELSAEWKLQLSHKKVYQKKLLEKLKYKRFGLVSSLSGLVNETSNAFIKKSEFLECLKGSPKTRALTSMRTFLKENVKFGLIILRIALEFLSSDMRSQDRVLGKSDYAFKFWIIKSPMEGKTKELFKNKLARNHIREVLEEIYQDVREMAKKEISSEKLQNFEAFFREKKSNQALDNESQSLLQKSQGLFNQCGKRSINLSDDKERQLKRQKRG